MSVYKIGLVQIDVKLHETQENQEKALSFIEQALKQGADFVILPEMWKSGFVSNPTDYAENENSALMNNLKKLARDYKAVIIPGSFTEVEKDKIYNTAYVIGANGFVKGKYRKIHIFGPEKKHYVGGNSIPIFEEKGLRFGIEICYDIRFPELTRILALSGARVIFVAAQFPNPRQEHWYTILRARAMENQLFVVAVNRVGEDKHQSYFGNSLVINPNGDVLLYGDDREKLLLCEISTDEVDNVRSIRNDLKERRPEVYKDYE